MPGSPLAPHLSSPAELKERIEAERGGKPFLVYRDDAGAQRIVALGDERSQLTVGSSSESDVGLEWDDQVSALHAELLQVAGEWLLVDDGLSRNGTHVNGERVSGRRRLHDSDELRIGQTVIVFRKPAETRRRITVVADAGQSVVEVSPSQQRVLVALCRPSAGGAPFARPATNQEIAEELSLTVAAVKTHLRTLFQRFGIQALPQNEKRAELARRALESGAVVPSALGDG
ncbi:MAG TPA: FHA domain-containing protein [Thermoleophilaceae bacterium]|nr:FHA domain-containing protein [Thermoleophilaceae bacterium]